MTHAPSLETATDQQVVGWARDGVEAAYRELLHRYERPVFSLIYRMVRDRELAVTFAPVPGFRRRAERLQPAEVHPWPWLRRPASGSISSFSSWRRSLQR